MPKLFLAGAIWLALTVGASAQTTTLDPAHCPTGTLLAPLALSGGNLILAGPPGTYYAAGNCWGTVGKWAGKWYFTVTLDTINGGLPIMGFGVAQGPSVPMTPVGWIGNYNAGGTIDSAQATNGFLTYAGSNLATIAAHTQGYTAAIAIDMDRAAGPEMWTTPDINCAGHGGCTGYGGGLLWNGSNTSSPELTGTGGKIAIPGYQAFPFFTVVAGSQLTAAFATNATVAANLPSYAPWNTSSGSGSAPTPISFQVANAPGWQAGHAYSLGSRVLAGPGWTPGSPGSFTNGQAIYLWALSGSGGTSGGSAPGGFASCALPAGVGGGFKTGVPPSGWSGKTTVSDNGLTWYCLTRVDYPTITDLNQDTPTLWATSTGYPEFRFIRNGTRYYQQVATITGSPYQCVSASSGGGPTVTTGTVADGTCTWKYYGTQKYSPTPSAYWVNEARIVDSGQRMVMGTATNVTATLWYGGTAAQIYQGGQGGEFDPLTIAYHNTGVDEGTFPVCKGQNYFLGSWPGNSSTTGGQTSCQGWNSNFIQKLTVASGDSFQDNISAASGPLRYDPLNGVALFSNSTGTLFGPGPCLSMRDNGSTVERIQCQTTQDVAMDWIFVPDTILHDNIIDSGSPEGAVILNGGSVVYNNLIVASGASTAGCFGILFKYAGAVYNNTIIGPGTGVTNCTAIQALGPIGAFANNVIVSNNVSFGFVHTYAYGTFGEPPSYTAGNNATDITTDAGSSFNSAFTDTGVNTMTSRLMPGLSQTGLTPSAQLINPTIGGSFDARIKDTGALYGNGATFTPMVLGSNGNLYPEPLQVPALDVLKVARPLSSRFDIGASQFTPAGPVTTGTGVGRRWGR